MRASIAAIAAAALVGCGEPYGSGTPDVQHDVEAGQTIELRVGQAVTAGGLRIAFQSVTQDSRCPRSVVCVWMGDAAVQLGLREGLGDEVVRELHTHPDFARRVELGGVEVTLVELAPYPVDPGTIPQDQYVARLTATTAR